jgi:prophage regulatory protein
MNNASEHKLIKMKEVKRITTLSRSTIHRLESQGSFPKRYELSSRVSAWDYNEVLEWIEKTKKNT